jgi:hypothetical protein
MKFYNSDPFMTGLCCVSIMILRFTNVVAYIHISFFPFAENIPLYGNAKFYSCIHKFTGICIVHNFSFITNKGIVNIYV